MLMMMLMMMMSPVLQVGDDGGIESLEIIQPAVEEFMEDVDGQVLVVVGSKNIGGSSSSSSSSARVIVTRSTTGGLVVSSHHGGIAPLKLQGKFGFNIL